MVRALLIEWKSTGERAGKINPRDPNLPCRGWQNMDVEPMVELRLVEDDRDLSTYQGVQGVTVLEGADAINAAIDEHFPARYDIDDQTIYAEHLRAASGEIDFAALPDDPNERLRVLKVEHGIKGIRETKPMRVE